MSDPVRDRALARRDAALVEAKRWEDWLRGYDELNGGANVAVPQPRAVQPAQSKPPAAAASPIVSETERRAMEILRRVGRHLTTREMLHELTSSGFAVTGNNPQGTLNTRLSRAPALIHVRPYGWTIRQVSEETDAAGASLAATPAASEETPTSSPVEPAAGGGT